MKKLTSVVLSVLMVISMLSCLFTGSVSAATPVNLIPNGDFENYDNGYNLKAPLPTDPNTVPDYCPDNTWGVNTNTGYFRATWAETIYDKDGNAYSQIKNAAISDYGTTNVVLEDKNIAYSGSKCLHNVHAAPVSLGLDNLEKNADYELSFYLRYKTDTNKICSIGITTTVNISNATLKADGMETSLEKLYLITK